MKKIIYFLFFLPILSCAQTIKTVWNYVAFDTTMAEHKTFTDAFKGQRQPVTPDELLSDQNNNIYVLNSSDMNWQVVKLSYKKGEILWQTSRNYKMPTLDSNQYFISDFFMNKDNTIEVLGTQLSVKYPKQGLWIVGPAAKAVYDMQSGKEKSYYSLIQKQHKGGGLIWNRGDSNRFLKKKGGYFIMDPLPYEAYHGLLRKLNDNFTKLDTLKILEPDAKSQKRVREGALRPYLINNSIHYIASMKSGISDFDSTNYYYRWFKLDTLGNILKQKDLNIKDFYNTFGWTDNKQVADGFLWSGIADTLNGSNIKTKFSYYIAKVDTNMTIKWRTFLPKQDDQVNAIFQMIELQDQKGYLVMQSNQNNKDAKTWLYHISLSGKTTFLGKVALNDTDDYFFPQSAIQLANKDIVFGYGLLKCWVNSGSQIVPCGGTALISYKNIENLVSNEELNFENTADAYRIYPNPSNDFINLELANEDKGVLTLFDVQGELIKIQEQKIESAIWQMPVSEISAGIYFLQIKRSNGEIRTEKVVVMH
jgi:hypothetical protein